MPLLETIRRGTDSTAMRLVFGAIVLVFVFWGIGNTGGPTASVIAEVNGIRITDTDFQRLMREEMRQQGGNQQDSDVTRELQRKVISRMIEREAFLQEAARVGIFVSDEEIARQLLEIPGFRDSDGVFEPKIYEKSLQRMGLKKGQFEEQLREDMQVGKLIEAVAVSVTVSDAEVLRAWQSEGTRMTLRFVEIPDEALLSEVPVPDGDIDAFVAASAGEIRAAYDADLEHRYSQPAKANLSAILLRTDMDAGKVDDAELRQRMQTLLDEARSGADFAQLARRWSEDLSAVNGGKLGTLAEPQLDPAVATAVFAAGAGKVTDIVETARGLQILSVNEVTPDEVTPYEAVERDIAREILARQRVAEFAATWAKGVQDRWQADGTAPTDLLDPQGLRVRAIPGISPASASRQLAVVGSPDLVTALAGVTGDGVLEPIFKSANGRVVAAVSDYEAADKDAFEDEKDGLTARLELQGRAEFVEAWRNDLIARSKVVQYYKP